MRTDQDFHESAGYLRISECCSAPTHKNRCTNCGHRQAVNGVNPVSSRKLTLTNPVYPVMELYGRHKARKQGRK